MDKNKPPEKWVDKIAESTENNPDKSQGRVKGKIGNAATNSPRSKTIPADELKQIIVQGEENKGKSFAERTGKSANATPKQQIIQGSKPKSFLDKIIEKGKKVGGGGRTTPKIDLNILDGKDEIMDGRDESLSQYEPEVDDKSQPQKYAGNEVKIDAARSERLYNLFHGINQESEKESMQNGKDEPTSQDTYDRLANLFQGNVGEDNAEKLQEFTDEQKEALYLAFNESDRNEEREDYFPIDKSASEDFANDRGNDDDMDVDMGAPDIGDGGDD